jgi:hypothetical protein
MVRPRTIALGLLLTAGLLGGGPRGAEAAAANNFCSNTAPNVVFYLDVTSAYDQTDQDALVSGIGQIFDALHDGSRLSIRTIEDTFTRSSELLDACLPYCPDNGFFGNLVSKCTEGVVINEKKKLRNEIRTALATRLHSASDLPKSEIVRTFATSATEEYRPGRDNIFFVFSDMIENSAYLPGSVFFSTPTAALTARLAKDQLVPNLSGTKIDVFGFGRSGVSGARNALPQDRIKKLTDFWRAYFQLSGATISFEQNLATGQ